MAALAWPRMFRPRLALAVLLCALGSLAVPARALETAPFLFRSWQSEDGLPGNVVRAVRQAADGYLWVATAEGVVRFDGVRFSGFDREPDATLARLPPRALFALPDGDVWISTQREGLLRWHAGRLTSVWPESNNVVTANVSQVTPDGSGGLLIARGAEVWRARGSAPPQPVERTPEIDALLQADREWLGEHGRSSAAGEGLRLRDRAGRLWSVQPGQGLTVSAPGAAPQAVPGVTVTDRLAELHEDREGSIWAATGESGLLQFRERRVSVLSVTDGLSDRTGFALLEDRSGALWVGGKSGGLDRVRGREVTHFQVGDIRLQRPIAALCEDRAGTIWAATRQGSVFRLDGGAFQPLPASFVGLTKIAAIAEDRQGAMWFGGVLGLHKLAAGRVIPFGEASGFASPAAPGAGSPGAPGAPASGPATPEITALTFDVQGALWVGTSNGLIFRGQDERFAGLPSNTTPRRNISALLAEEDGSLWAATLGSGLWLWRGGREWAFGENEGLPDLRLTCVLDDGAGYLWLGSLSGIFRVSKGELAAIAEGRRKEANWLQLDRSDGMLSRECTGNFQPAGWRRRDGSLLFPTANGVVRVQPAGFRTNPVPPPVVLEECRAGGRLLAGPQLEIGPGRTRLVFRYTGLSFAPPEKVQFRVRLAGLETEWRDVGALRTTAYDALPPGNYRFHVTAANGDGVWNPAPASVAVRVLPHFWETAWFRTLVATLAIATAAAISGGVVRARAKRRLARLELQTAREKERARIARDLHDDLGASLTEISMLAHLAAEDTTAPAAVREPLAEIAGKAHTLVGALDEIVWAVNPRHDTLASVADYLPAIASEFLEPTDLALRLDVARDLPPLALDAERRHGLFLAMREALNNAVKHAHAREILLRLHAEDGHLTIELRDDGRGFEASAEQAGEGLRNLRERMIALGGEARIESMPGTGTSVQLSLPLP